MQRIVIRRSCQHESDIQMREMREKMSEMRENERGMREKMREE